MRRALIIAAALLWAPPMVLAAPDRPDINLIVFDMSKDCGVRVHEIEGRLRRVLKDANIQAVRGGSSYALFVEVQGMPLTIAPGCAGRLGMRFVEASNRKSQFLPGGKRVQILLWENSALLHSRSSYGSEAMASVERQALQFVAWFHDPS